MLTSKTRLGNYLRFNGSLYQRVANEEAPVTEEKHLPNEDEWIYESLIKARKTRGPTGRVMAEQVLYNFFTEEPVTESHDEDVYEGTGEGSQWVAFVDDEETITFEHASGKRLVFVDYN